jgi:phosphoribosyl 1,2-cyclic phosphodiesterase
MADELRVKFWGVRGSYPTPGAGTVRYGGNTASVEIRLGEQTIVLDAGTGIIPLGRELVRRQTTEVVLLLSHLHHDHTQGLPFFLPAYLPNLKLHIFGPDGATESLRKVLEHNQSFETFPVSLRDMASSKNIQSVRETQLIVWNENGARVMEAIPGSAVRRIEELNQDAIILQVHRSYAHPGGVLVYRIHWRGRSIVYATDTEGYAGMDRRLVKFALNADLLIHDAQYMEEHYWGQLAGFPSTQGYGHSTAGMACEVAAAARVGQLILFHHDPAYSDEMIAHMEAEAKGKFGRVQTAYEGMEITLRAKNKITSQLQHEQASTRDVKYADHG